MDKKSKEWAPILNIETRNVEEDANLNATQRYRKLYPRVVKLVAKVADNYEPYAFVEGMLKEMEKTCSKYKKIFKYYSR